MEIHAPEGPVHSFKDFLIHISIITLGVLIALSREGVRELIHNRHLVRETRENVHEEMKNNLDRVRIECSRVKQYSAGLKVLVAAMPALAQQNPGQISTRLSLEGNPGYFLVANSWEAALSTGVLAHIPTAEVEAYAYAAQGIRNYTALQNATQPTEAHAKAFAAAYSLPTPLQVQQEMELLLLFDKAEEGLAFVCPQVERDIERALSASSP